MSDKFNFEIQKIMCFFGKQYSNSKPDYEIKVFLKVCSEELTNTELTYLLNSKGEHFCISQPNSFQGCYLEGFFNVWFTENLQDMLMDILNNEKFKEESRLKKLNGFAVQLRQFIKENEPLIGSLKNTMNVCSFGEIKNEERAKY